MNVESEQKDSKTLAVYVVPAVLDLGELHLLQLNIHLS